MEMAETDLLIKRVSERIFGLTGGIACGKSEAAAVLRELGAVIIDCDIISRELTVPGSEALKLLTEAFGSRILDGKGELKRKYLASLVFGSKEALQKLNDIMQRRIWKRAFEMAAEAAMTNKAVFIAAPLLFEHGAEAAVSKVWVVDTSEDIQLKRLLRRDRLSPEEAQARLDSQMKAADKAARADVLIDNNGSLDDLRREIEAAWHEHFEPAEG
ncbi:dephospho-CoA kinase [bacterium]|nr:dephospho-CoA kinase [bacterium]